MSTSPARSRLLLALLLLALVGTPRPAAGEEERDRAHDGILRVCLPTAVKTIDPVKAHAEGERTIVLNVYDQLFQYHHLARPFRLEPALAAEMPVVSEDGLRWTIRLRKGIRYADDPCFEGGKGRAVTAADVAFCLLRVSDHAAGSKGTWLLQHRVKGIDAFLAASKQAKPDPHRVAYTKAAGYPPVEGIHVVDDHTLEIRLDKPYPQLVWVLATSYGAIYPPEAVAHHGAGMARHAVTSGPYKVLAYGSTKSLTLTRNTAYRDVRYPDAGNEDDEGDGMLRDAGARLPLNGMVLVSAEPDEMKRWNRFRAGESDHCSVPRDATWTVVAPGRFDLIPEAAKEGFQLHDDQRLEVFYDAFNMRHPVWGQQRGDKGLAIRRAICLAHDDTWAIDRLYGGLAIPLRGPLLPEHAAHDPFFQNDWQRKPEEDREDAIELAREILAEAGFPGGKGIPPLRRQVLDHPSSQMRFRKFKKDMAAIGLTFIPDVVTWEEQLKRIRAGTAEMWSISWQLDHPDPENLMQLFYGPHAFEPNDSGYANEEFDKLYEKAQRTPPGPDREVLFQDMQEIVAEDCVYRWRFRQRHLSTSHGWLANWRGNDIAPRWFAYCRVDENKRRAWLDARKATEDAGSGSE